VEEFNEKRIQILPIILTERAYLPSKEVTNPKRLKSCSSVRVRAQNLMGEAACSVRVRAQNLMGEAA
jgi:hypothetical protein